MRPDREGRSAATEESLTALISSRLPVESIERIVALVAGADQDEAGPAGGGTKGESTPPVLAKVKEAPGNVSLETMLTEIDKLLAVRAIGLPKDLTAVASDSTHVRAYDQNLFTEWHSRYGGRGVLVYWHVESTRRC